MQIIDIALCVLAEDMVLFAENEEELKHSLTILVQELKRFIPKLIKTKRKLWNREDWIGYK